MWWMNSSTTYVRNYIRFKGGNECIHNWKPICVSVLYRQANQGCHFNTSDTIILVRHLYISPNELNSLVYESSLLVPLLKGSTYKQCRNISDGVTFQIRMFYLQLFHAISFIYSLKNLFTVLVLKYFHWLHWKL